MQAASKAMNEADLFLDDGTDSGRLDGSWMSSGHWDDDPGILDEVAGASWLPPRPRLIPPEDQEIEEPRDRSRSPMPAANTEDDQVLDTSMFTEAGFIDGDRFDCMAVEAATKSAGHIVMKQPWELGVLSRFLKICQKIWLTRCWVDT